MKTTAIIAEQVVSGFLLICWIGLFVIEPVWFKNMLCNKFLASGLSLIPLTLLILMLLYVFGVVSDRISDILIGFIFSWLPATKVIQSEFFGGLSESDKYRIEILVAEGSLGGFIDYLRTIIRLSRSAAFNLFPITIAIYSQVQNALILFIGSFLWIGSVLAWSTLSCEYQMTLKHGVKLNSGHNDAKSRAAD